MENQAPGKSTTGLPDGVAGLLCYVLGFVSGIVFLAVEKGSTTVRFHAMQSIVVFLGLFVASLASALIPFIGWIVALLISPATFVLWLLLMYKAYTAGAYRLPVASEIADSLLLKLPAPPPQGPGA